MAETKKDLALVYAPADDGDGFKILRKRAQTDRIETGLVRPLREGKNIVGEVLRMERRDDSPLLFDVETDRELSTMPATDSLGRPAQVASDRYRRGWDAVWGDKPQPVDVN